MHLVHPSSITRLGLEVFNPIYVIALKLALIGLFTIIKSAAYGNPSLLHQKWLKMDAVSQTSQNCMRNNSWQALKSIESVMVPVHDDYFQKERAHDFMSFDRFRSDNFVAFAFSLTPCIPLPNHHPTSKRFIRTSPSKCLFIPTVSR